MLRISNFGKPVRIAKWFASHNIQSGESAQSPFGNPYRFAKGWGAFPPRVFRWFNIKQIGNPTEKSMLRISNFGKPERIAKESASHYIQSRESAKSASNFGNAVSFAKKKKDAKYRVSTSFAQ